MAEAGRGRELLLLRHGIAEERSPGRDDRSRVLTEPGRRRAQAVLRRAVDLGLGGGRLLTSPLPRARQTAEIAVAVGLAPALEVVEALAPGADPLPLLEQGWATPPGEAASGCLVLVGHEPDLGLLAARLIGAAPGSIPLRKAGLALLDLPPEASAPFPGRARLRLLLSPRVLLS
ncbi:MAG: histidine phosphatase family protein [Synechococcaceae cyanobacterium]|nr:histidine phosphatase family protein [Synechococcaceae cyanobacterium]